MPNPFDLTMRERQVMELVCEGAGYPEIAERLQVSPRLARRRFELAVDKIGVTASRRSIAAAVKFDRAMRSQHQEATHA
jgi:DNA-binding CsgD family transcriptional regulator